MRKIWIIVLIYVGKTQRVICLHIDQPITHVFLKTPSSNDKTNIIFKNPGKQWRELSNKSVMQIGMDQYNETSKTQCQSKCSSDPNCHYYLYQPNINRCWVSKGEGSAGRILGFKVKENAKV